MGTISNSICFLNFFFSDGKMKSVAQHVLWTVCFLGLVVIKGRDAKQDLSALHNGTLDQIADDALIAVDEPANDEPVNDEPADDERADDERADDEANPISIEITTKEPKKPAPTKRISKDQGIEPNSNSMEITTQEPENLATNKKINNKDQGIESNTNSMEITTREPEKPASTERISRDKGMESNIVSVKPPIDEANTNSTEIITREPETPAPTKKISKDKGIKPSIVIVKPPIEEEPGLIWGFRWWELLCIVFGTFFLLLFLCACCCAILESGQVRQQEVRGPNGERLGFMQAPGRHIVLVMDNRLSRFRGNNVAAANNPPTTTTGIAPAPVGNPPHAPPVQPIYPKA